MRRDERTADIERAIRIAIESNNRELMVVLPVKVVSYNAADKPATVRLQPTIQMRRQKPDGQVINESLPEIPRAPVHFLGGGGFAMTHPINPGDEGHIMVSSRCIEGWMQQGDVQPMPHVRYHDLTDAIFIPGLRSKPRALSNISTNSVQLRSDDGNAVLDFQGGQMELTFSGGAKFTFKSNGDLEISGEIIIKKGTLDIHGSTHKHSGVQTGGSLTNAPVAGT